MRNVLILFFFLFLININSKLEAQTKGFRLEGIISNADSVTTITIMPIGNNEITNTTSKVIDGKFIFEGQVAHPCLAILNSDKVRAGLGVWLTNGVIKVNLSPYKYEGQKTYSLQTLSIDGPQESQDFILQMNLQNKIAQTEKNILKRNMLIGNEIEKYINGHKNSYLSLFLVSQGIYYCGAQRTKSQFALLSKELQSCEEGRDLQKEIEKAEQNSIGKTIDDFTIPNAQGQLTQLSSTVKGKTIVNFWASWCGPCRLENKVLVKSEKLLEEKSVKVISISLDDDKEAWLKAIQKDGLNWLQLSELKGGFESDLAKKLKITGIPYTLLIDENLKILSTNFQDMLLLIKNL
jgi:thiol-disulfide isomerase/thioredoxin